MAIRGAGVILIAIYYILVGTPVIYYSLASKDIEAFKNFHKKL